MARKVSNERSVKVSVPANTTIEAGDFVYLGGFLGMALSSVKTGAGETSEVVLEISSGVYEIEDSKIEGTLTKGEKVYFNPETGKFTNSSTDTILAGVVVDVFNGGVYIWFNPVLALI